MNITSTFKGEKPKIYKELYKNNYYKNIDNNLPSNDNIKWYNDIC